MDANTAPDCGASTSSSNLIQVEMSKPNPRIPICEASWSLTYQLGSSRSSKYEVLRPKWISGNQCRISRNRIPPKKGRMEKLEIGVQILNKKRVICGSWTSISRNWTSESADFWKSACHMWCRLNPLKFKCLPLTCLNFSHRLFCSAIIDSIRFHLSCFILHFCLALLGNGSLCLNPCLRLLSPTQFHFVRPEFASRRGGLAPAAQF